GISLDELFGARPGADHVLARRDRLGGDAALAALFDDPRGGVRAYLVQLGPDEDGAPLFAARGVELVLVAQGLVLVELEDSTPAMRAGDALMVRRGRLRGWRNLGAGPARLFWVVADAGDGDGAGP